MGISTFGVDLAKNIFQVHAETADGAKRTTPSE